MGEQRDLAAALAGLPAEIRQMLREDLPVDRQRCESAAAAGRWGELREQVHRTKGTAQFCRMEALKQICTEIETALDGGRPVEPRSLVLLAEEIGLVLDTLGPAG